MKNFKDTDFILWAKLKAGDATAIGKLYDHYVDELFTYGVQFTANKSDVMDSIHDLFLNLYKYRKKLANTTNVRYYLMRSLKNEILKKAKINPFLSTSAIDENTQNKIFYSSVEDTLIEEEINNDRFFRLNLALNSLSKKQRHILYLRFNEEKEYAQIAKTLNVSIETSRTMIYRAIKKLRKKMLTLMLLFFYFF